MRTTLTLDDDLAEALKERARVMGLSLKEVVNEVLRHGLARGAVPGQEPDRFRIEAEPRGFRPGIDTGRLNQLVDELELAGLSRDPAAARDMASHVHEKGERPEEGGGS